MKTVKRSHLEAWVMFDGGEDMHPIVIDGQDKLVWAGTHWFNAGQATDEDKAQFPKVVED